MYLSRSAQLVGGHLWRVVTRSWQLEKLGLASMFRDSLGDFSLPADVSQCMNVLCEQANHYTIDHIRLDFEKGVFPI